MGGLCTPVEPVFQQGQNDLRQGQRERQIGQMEVREGRR
jgi:hypothetical protein